MIRLAEIRDVSNISIMLREYAQVNEMKYAKDGFSLPKTAEMVSSCVMQGLVWVSDNNGLEGVLVAQERLNMFSQTVSETHLLVIYVKPEFRSGTVGGRLLLAYDKETESRGILMSWVGTRATSEMKESSLNKLGYKLQEKFYIKER